jgi:Cytidine deaminase
MDNFELIELAKKVRTNAYAPFSHFLVGAALLTKQGKVFTGCNIEDPSSIGATNICAERCACVKAISGGYLDFEKIAVVGGKDELIFTTPCGICRQYLNSFNREIIIVCLDNNQIKEFKLKELLPYSFNETFN